MATASAPAISNRDGPALRAIVAVPSRHVCFYDSDASFLAACLVVVAVVVLRALVVAPAPAYALAPVPARGTTLAPAPASLHFLGAHATLRCTLQALWYVTITRDGVHV